MRNYILFAIALAISVVSLYQVLDLIARSKKELASTFIVLPLLFSSLVSTAVNFWAVFYTAKLL